MPSARTVIRQALIAMATMFLANVVADQVGGTTRQIIKGELTLWDRLFG